MMRKVGDDVVLPRTLPLLRRMAVMLHRTVLDHGACLFKLGLPFRMHVSPGVRGGRRVGRRGASADISVRAHASGSHRNIAPAIALTRRGHNTNQAHGRATLRIICLIPKADRYSSN